MSRQYLIKETGKFYKANLHSHSNLSDGRLTPEEMKKAYKDHGYSILSLTDHEILLDHRDMSDDDFLMLNGYEIDISDDSTDKQLHANLFPIDQNNLTQVCYSNEYVWGNARNYINQIKFDYDGYKRVHTPEKINEFVKIATEHGFLVSFNHPVWSCEVYEDYIHYDGFFAMEILNYGCYIDDGLPEYNPVVYDAMLRHGHRLGCISTDDNHDWKPFEHPQCDSFGGFTMIKADALTADEVIKSLQNYDYYASTGPEIKELYVEDFKVHITTSDARFIRISGDSRKGGVVAANEGDTVNSAVFDLEGKRWNYFRLEVRDWKGNVANSNAYFLDGIER